LLGLDVKQLEGEIASMVSNGTVYAKIDRPADIIRFEQKKSSEAVLTGWADNIDKLLHLVETTTHLIHKERKINAK
jgi:26S proteasome regulatory subunit N5